MTIGSPTTPVIDDREFRFILSQFPSWVKVKTKSETTRCDCWDDESGSYDPDCSNCSDGWMYSGSSDRTIQAIMQPFWPHGRSSSGDFVTQAGRVQRYDYSMWTHGWEWGKIVTGDVVIYPVGKNVQQYEFNVMHSLAHPGTHGNIVYCRFLLWKKPVGENMTFPTQPKL